MSRILRFFAANTLLLALAALLLIAGSVQAATVLFPSGGGLGSNAAPTLGKIPVGTSGGVYAPTSTISGPITVAGTTTLATTTAILSDKGGQVFNVKAYGAKCNGTTDDTSAIQSAVNASELTYATSSQTGGEIYFPKGECLISNTITITGSNVRLVGPTWSITHPQETNDVFLGQPAAALLPSATFPANAYVVDWNNTTKMISGGGMDNMSIDGRLVNGVVSNVKGIHLGNALFFTFDHFQIADVTGDGIMVDQAGATYPTPSTSQLWFTNFTIYHTGLNGIEFGAGVFMSDVYISNFWMSAMASGSGIKTSDTGTGAFNIYISNGTVDASNYGIYMTAYETHISDVNLTNSFNSGLYINQHANFGYSSTVHNVIAQDNDKNQNGSAGIYVASGSYDYNFTDDVAEGVNTLPEYGFYLADGNGVDRNLLNPGDFARGNLHNFQLKGVSFSQHNIVALAPSGGYASIGTSTLSASLFVQGTSSTPSANLITVASSTGTSVFTITSAGKVGVGVTPTQPLQVSGTIQADNYRITQSNAYYFDTSSSVHFAKYDNTSSLDGVFISGFGGVDLGANGAHTLIRVNSTGVGIGTTNPWTKLSVSGGFAATASSTIGDGTQIGGLTISGGATTTGNSYLSGNVTVIGTLNTFNFGTAVGTTNFVIGPSALASSPSGDHNMAIGYDALNLLTSGYQNLGIGANALQKNLSGHDNVAVGSAALLNNTSNSNIAVGVSALNIDNTGDNNTAVGDFALQNATTYGNTAFGSQAGNSITSGNSNTFLGRDAGHSGNQLATAVNSMALGQGTYTTASNQVVIGNTSITQTLLNGSVGIGTTSPATTFVTQGPAQFVIASGVATSTCTTAIEGSQVYNLGNHHLWLCMGSEPWTLLK